MFHIAVAAISASRVRIIHGVVRERVKGVLSRTAGLMRGANSLYSTSTRVQGSSRYPHLRMSRVLMSLNDYDVPVGFIDIEQEPGVVMKFIGATLGLLVFLSLVVVVLLPRSW